MLIRAICVLAFAAIASTSAHANFLEVDPVGYEDQMNLYAYCRNDPLSCTDPTGEASFYVKVKAEATTGTVGQAVMSHFAGEPSPGGGGGSVGVAVSFPFFDGDQFDVGVVASGTLSDVPTGNSGGFASLPGGSVGVVGGLNSGSLSDLRGQSTAQRTDVNIGKKVSRGIVGGLARALPNGPIKNFVTGPVQRAANSILGLVASGAITQGENGNIGGEIGLAKGVNIGSGADVDYTVACTARTGCE